MNDLLFVGGPIHGQRKPVMRDREGNLPTALTTLDVEGDDILDRVFTQIDYYLRFCHLAQERVPIYATPRHVKLYGQVHTDSGRLADYILTQLHPDAIPTCFAPDCAKKAPTLFTAKEHGRLGGKDVEHGQEIRLCPAHANDIYIASGAYGRDQLPEWLRNDRNFDWIDAYDIGHALDPDQMMTARTRALRLTKATYGETK